MELGAERNEAGATAAGEWPEDQTLHRGRRPGRCRCIFLSSHSVQLAPHKLRVERNEAGAEVPPSGQKTRGCIEGVRTQKKYV